MSTPQKTPPKSIVRPGPSPQGPEGWEERRLERESNLAGGARKGAAAGDLAAQANPGTAEAASTAEGEAGTDTAAGAAPGAAAGSGNSSSSSSPLAAVKKGVRKVGVKMSLVEPKMNELDSTRKDAAMQDASTGPELA
ncbi:hypothetical protein BCV69DRAFT_282305 [Microstroma glucosiphilum]|uniref:Uncharacterized protein n=1 Tax=Pseudomicrostroma glucosiphilum TaxID=1684307 RepID=A0A316U8P3_9BASI|nr:hypothetical protein BCV69DRAFT_282305 [Pseudomicrostroma glucosiphilum]PWN21586.1 hypothetical protein BCV69DRAFT_282305 [Pseudomicrostroma glucosiphilum]